MEIAIPLIAGLVIAVLCGLLLSLSFLARRRDMAVLGQHVCAMLDSEPGARLLLSADGRVIHANEAGRLLWGDHAPLAVLAGRLADEDGNSDALLRLRNACEAGVPERVEIALQPQGAPAFGTDWHQPDPVEGSEAAEWWAITVRPVVKRAGLGDGASVWMAEDVTARRAIEDILVREREDLAEFLYFTPVGVYSADSAGRFRMVNQRLAEWLGTSSDALLMTPVEETLAEGDIPEADGSWSGQLTFRGAQGQVFPALLVQGTYDDGGEIRTRSVVLRADGGEEMPALHTLADLGDGAGTAQQFRWLFDGAPVGLCLIDFEGIVTDCNPAFEKISGFQRAQLVDHPLSQVLAEADRYDLDALMQRVAVGEKTSAHREVRLSQGGDAAAALYVGPMGEGQGADGLIAYFIDTTAQRTLEAQFAQAQKMQAMGQLAGGVAHDFNNLLTAMIGFCDLLLLRHGAGDPSFSDLMQIKQNANRAANLVRQLLAFSRMQPLTPRKLDPTDALTEMSHLLRRLIGESVELEMVHGRDVGPVRVDPGQFDQVIINLAVNARDAMPGGGRLTIRTRSETVETAFSRGAEQVPPGVYTLISVCDTGTGIARENLARIFEPFFSTKTGQVGAGTGLGLSTVYGIIRQTGGFLFVDSVVGSGTTFTIYLPRYSKQATASEKKASATPSQGALPSDDLAAQKAAAASAEDSSERSEPSDGSDSSARAPDAEKAGDLTGGGQILLVEDEDPVRIFAARALRNKGYKVQEARTGEGALDILEDHINEIDLLVTDMVMPGMDGATLARLVRQERPGLPVILISGYSEEAARGELTESVDFHFLPKPFSLTQLAAKVKEVLLDAAG
jgi:two-component system cell cycle sensor histidine kinase/response regulator CckA